LRNSPKEPHIEWHARWETLSKTVHLHRMHQISSYSSFTNIIYVEVKKNVGSYFINQKIYISMHMYTLLKIYMLIK
jgi:hypothetical protein